MPADGLGNANCGRETLSSEPESCFSTCPEGILSSLGEVAQKLPESCPKLTKCCSRVAPGADILLRRSSLAEFWHSISVNLVASLTTVGQLRVRVQPILAALGQNSVGFGRIVPSSSNVGQIGRLQANIA